MTMSKDRVRFILPPRYFQSGRRANGFNCCTMMAILRKAFGMTNAESGAMMDADDDFEIECRPSQFARFIILRYEANEGLNGVRDLEPRMVQPTKPRTLYERVGDELNVDPCVVKAVASALIAIENTAVHPSLRPLDVSGRSTW